MESQISSGGKVIRIRSTGKLPKSAMKFILSDTKRDFTSVGNESYFTTKIKLLKDGFENNIENELLIHDPNTMDACLHDMGYRCWFEKSKYSYGSYRMCDDRRYHIEIERVSVKHGDEVKHVWYVEIENTDSNDATEETLIADEKAIFKELGLDPNKVDNRPWVKILE